MEKLEMSSCEIDSMGVEGGGLSYFRHEAQKIIQAALDLEVQEILGRLARERSKRFRRYFKPRVAYLLSKHHTQNTPV